MSDEIIPLSEVLDGLREALAPEFERKKAAWDENGQAALDACRAAGIELETYGGNCPVQVEGTFDGKAFYFRARGDSWQFHVADTPADTISNDIHYAAHDYGTGFDAGWMDTHEALMFVVKAVADYRATQPSD